MRFRTSGLTDPQNESLREPLRNDCLGPSGLGRGALKARILGGKFVRSTATNVQKVKRNWFLSKLLELIQAGLITVNTQRAFQTVDDGGYWPVGTTRLDMLRKAVDNYGNNGNTIGQIEKYVKDNVQSVIDFAFEPATKAKGRKKIIPTVLQTAIDLPCPRGCA